MESAILALISQYNNFQNGIMNLLYLVVFEIWYSSTFEGEHITARYRKWVLKVLKGEFRV